jgi:biopolymer transport protein ExbB/TolQ
VIFSDDFKPCYVPIDEGGQSRQPMEGTYKGFLSIFILILAVPVFFYLLVFVLGRIVDCIRNAAENLKERRSNSKVEAELEKTQNVRGGDTTREKIVLFDSARVASDIAN